MTSIKKAETLSFGLFYACIEDNIISFYIPLAPSLAHKANAKGGIASSRLFDLKPSLSFLCSSGKIYYLRMTYLSPGTIVHHFYNP